MADASAAEVKPSNYAKVNATKGSRWLRWGIPGTASDSREDYSTIYSHICTTDMKNA